MILDPDGIGVVASGCEVLVDRLGPGDGVSRLRQVQYPDRWGFDLPVFHCNLCAEAGLDTGCLVVLLVLRAAGSSMCGIPLEDCSILILPVGTSITASVKPGLLYCGAVMPEGNWFKSQETTTGMVSRLYADRPVVTKITEQALWSLWQLLKLTLIRVGQEFRAAGNARATPDQCLGYVDALADAFAHGEGRYEAIDRGLRNRTRLAFQAKAFIHDRIDDPVSTREICGEMNVSRRQLEYAFNTTFGVGPQEFVNLLRLNAARRDLLLGRTAGITATVAAFDHGINHLGRFAARYRQLFGELPSETLRRSEK